MRVGDRVRARTMHRESGSQEWSVIFKEGEVIRDFLLCVGNQALFRVRLDDGSEGNFWNDQLENVAS